MGILCPQPLEGVGCLRSMTLYAGYIQSSGASMWGSCWSRPLTIGPTRLRSGLGFADPHDQQMGLMTHPTLGSQVAGTVMDRVSDTMPALCLGMPPLPVDAPASRACRWHPGWGTR